MRTGYNALLGWMYDQHPLQKDLLVHYTPHDLLLCQLHYQMDQLWWSWQIDRMALYELLCHCWDKYDIINHQLAQQHLILSLPGSERWIFLCNFSSRVVCVIRKKLIWTLLGAIKKIFKSIDRSRLTGEVKVNDETEDTVLGLELEAAIIACRSSSDTKLKFESLFDQWENERKIQRVENHFNMVY